MSSAGFAERRSWKEFWWSTCHVTHFERAWPRKQLPQRREEQHWGMKKDHVLVLLIESLDAVQPDLWTLQLHKPMKPFPFLPPSAGIQYLSVCLSTYLPISLSLIPIFICLSFSLLFFLFLFLFLLLNLFELGSVPLSKYDYSILFFFPKSLSWDAYPPEQFENCGSSSFSPTYFLEFPLLSLPGNLRWLFRVNIL